MNVPPLLELRGATVKRGAALLLDGIDWSILPGQQWLVTGPNGCGKTLLMHVLSGRVPVFPGEIRYAEAGLPLQITQVSFEQAQRILAREQELEETRSYSGSEEEGTRVAAFLGNASSDLLAAFHLEKLLDSPLAVLSNGEMRKVLLIRALQAQLRLLLLDEPFDGLDAASRAALAGIIRQAAAEGRQMILVTHHVDEMEAPFTHLLRLEEGRVVNRGPRRLHPETRPQANVLPDAGSMLPVPVPEAGPPVVEMRGLRIAYGERVIIEGLNWSVRRGEHWAVVGPNGAGKTTLLRLISADHLQAYANDITLFGRPRGSGESIWEIKQRIGVLSPELQSHYREGLSVRQVVLSGFFDSVGLFRQATPEQALQAQGWLDLLSLDGDAPYTGCSYGQKRVVLLARALVKNPELLLLDEPCQGLDPDNRRRLIDLVSRVAEQRGTQLIYVTHRREELPRCITHRLEFHPAGERFCVSQTAYN